MIEWLKYDKWTIFRDKSKNGLFVNFIRDYEKDFGEKVIVGCGKCLSKCYNNFIKKYTMTDIKEKHGFVLKIKYNGIKSKTNGSPCRNADLTIEQAIDLMENHPHGKNLFYKIPSDYGVEKIEVKAEVVETKKVVKRKRKSAK